VGCGTEWMDARNGSDLGLSGHSADNKKWSHLEFVHVFTYN
jgi:hypothetical protein